MPALFADRVQFHTQQSEKIASTWYTSNMAAADWRHCYPVYKPTVNARRLFFRTFGSDFFPGARGSKGGNWPLFMKM